METIGCYWLAIGCSLRTSRVGALVPERVRKLAGRVKGWYRLRQSPPAERKIAVAVYGFPPNVGAVGTAALLDVPKSLYMLFCRLEKEGYDLGGWPCATVDGAGSTCSSETLIAALGVLSEESDILVGANGIADRLEQRDQVPKIQKRLIFELATELMEYNQVGSFNMKSKEGE